MKKSLDKFPKKHILNQTLRKEVSNACKEKESNKEEDCKEDNKEEEKEEIAAGISTDTSIRVVITMGGSNSPHIFSPTFVSILENIPLISGNVRSIMKTQDAASHLSGSMG